MGSMSVGGWRVRTLLDGTLGLDGGSMFGVVPKPLWSRTTPADDRNRIRLAARLLLLEGHGRLVLVDTGLGDKWSDKRRAIFDVQRPGGGVLGALAKLGIEPAQVTDVLLTHLHFDHAAGTTRRVDDGMELVFPSARHIVQRRQWEWAARPTLKDAGSFRPEDFELLGHQGSLVLVDGDTELFPGIDVIALDGHTAAMQAVKIRGPEATLLYVADLVPTVAHLRWPYIMGYDNRPLVTLAEKQRHLLNAARQGWIVVFEHDSETAAVRLQECDGTVRPRESVEL